MSLKNFLEASFSTVHLRPEIDILLYVVLHFYDKSSTQRNFSFN